MVVLEVQIPELGWLQSGPDHAPTPNTATASLCETVPPAAPADPLRGQVDSRYNRVMVPLVPKQAYHSALLAGGLESDRRAQAAPPDLSVGRVAVTRLSLCHRRPSLSLGS